MRSRLSQKRPRVILLAVKHLFFRTVHLPVYPHRHPEHPVTNLRISQRLYMPIGKLNICFVLVNKMDSLVPPYKIRSSDPPIANTIGN